MLYSLKGTSLQSRSVSTSPCSTTPSQSSKTSQISIDLNVGLDMDLDIKIVLFFSQPCESDPATESWRSAVETQLIQYVSDHYPHGVCAVYARTQGSAVTLTMCIEDHQFQPKNYWYVVNSLDDNSDFFEYSFCVECNAYYGCPYYYLYLYFCVNL